MKFLNISTIIYTIITVAGIGLLMRFVLLHKKNQQHKLIQNQSYKFSQYLFNLKTLGIFLALFFTYIAVLGPRWGEQKSQITSQGADILFTLDVSQSMNALDYTIGSKSVSRLNFAKQMISSYVNEYPNHRYGLVIFAGEAFVSTPVTSDETAFLTFLDGIDTKDAGEQGTDLKTALQTSIDRFVSKDENQGKAVILMSDGGDDLPDNYKEVAKKAKENQIKVFTAGMGSKKGSPIPISQDFWGKISYKKYNGDTVITKLNPKTLKDLADISDSQYIQAKDINDLEKFTKTIKNLKVSEYNQKTTVQRKSQYQIFLFFGLVFFLVWVFIPKGKKIMPLIFLMIFAGGCKSDIGFRYYNTQGNRSFEQNYFEDAKSSFQKADKSTDTFNHIAQNNHAVTQYDQMDYSQAEHEFDSLIKMHCTKTMEDKCNEIYYNQGNSLFREGEKAQSDQDKKNKWLSAIESYQNTLRIDPEDAEAQENIDFIENKLKEQEQQKQNNDSQNSDQQNGEQSDKDQQSSAQEGEQSQTAQQQPIDEQTQKQLEKYMQQMQENEKKMQEYFQRNPEAQKQQNNDSLFNDPFFDQIFGRDPNFQGRNNDPNKKDW